jgi:hypothetical protein
MQKHSNKCVILKLVKEWLLLPKNIYIGNYLIPIYIFDHI